MDKEEGKKGSKRKLSPCKSVTESKKSDKQKLVSSSDESEDSDYAFETPMKKRREEVVDAEPKRKNCTCFIKDYRSIYVRNKPSDLISVMKDFTVEQQNSVKKIGFDSILGTTIENMPLKLGLWLVENYDPDTNTLQIGNKSLLITRQNVNDVYGLPMGNTPISAFKRTRPDNSVVQEFRNQFSTKDGIVKMSDVLPELAKDVTGGRKFILNFLVSVATVFLGGTTYGAVNQKFLPDIQADTNIMDLDWCTYTLECLNSGIKSWDFTNKTKFFSGPLLFLIVLYVSSTTVPREIVKRRFPLMNCWTAEKLKKREAKEMKGGGFGKLKLADGVMLIDNNVDETVEEVLGSEGTRATTKEDVNPKENQVRQGLVTRSKAKSKQEGNLRLFKLFFVLKESKKSDKQKLVLSSDESEGSDYAFETPMKKRREVVGTEPKSKNGKCLNKDYQSMCIPNPPSDLISVMKHFTVEQQNSVKKIGFGSILGTTIENMPSKLGFWLVKNYDPDSNTLQIGNRSLLITRQTVNDVYGLPMGNTPISAFKRTRPDDFVVQEFQNQFSTKDGIVKMPDVLLELAKDVTGGRKFILNFLVSVVTVFLGGTTYGAVNQKFLPDIQADTNIMDLDWCTYTLECLNSGIKSWDFTNKTKFFSGPLLFLIVLYVSSTTVPREIVKRRFPLMNCWTAEKLKKREAKEMKGGGFGKLKLADGVMLIDNNVDETVEEVLGSEGTRATTKEDVNPKENQVRQGLVTRSKAKSKQEGNLRLFKLFFVLKESKKSDKQKLVSSSDESEDSDYAFETPMKKRREVVGTEPKSKNGKCLNKDYQSMCIPNPPSDLISVMKHFTVEQQNSVKKIGFGSILGTTIENMPSKLGFWLVENYDPDSNTLQIGNRSLLITRQTVNDVYGLPMGNTPISAFKRTRPDDFVVQEFLNQFSTKDGIVKMSDVLPELAKDVTGGRKFILNFLVSVVTVFLGGTSHAAVNQKFLPDIQADTDIMDLDWCTYTLECLNSGRKTLGFPNKTNYFSGPLLFLIVLYVSATIVPGEIVEWKFPLMNCWTAEKLKKREEKEMIDGGFGKLKLADGGVLVDNNVDDTVEEVLESEDMAQCSGHNEDLEFIPESTLSQYPPEQPTDWSKNKFKNIIVAKSLHPTEFCGYTIRERFVKLGWEQLLDFECDKIYRRIVIDWTTSLSRKGDELTGIVDGNSYTISPTIIRDILKVDTRTDLPYARFNQAEFQAITDENEIRWEEACKTAFGHELDKNVAISSLEMTPLVKILWEIGLWTFHPRLKDKDCVLAREIYLLHALYTGEYLYSFAHLMIDDIWSMYEDEYEQTIPHVYYLSEILARLGAVSQDERIEVVDPSHREITRSSFKDLQFSESPTRYIIYDRVLKQRVTFLKKATEVEAPPKSPPHLMPIPNPLADKTNNPKDLIDTQSQKQLDDMMSIISNMQKHMEQQAFEAKHRDQERDKWAEIQAHTMTNNLQNLLNKQSEEQQEKMMMMCTNMQKQMGDEAECQEQAREKREEERETHAKIKAHAMTNDLQNLITKQFQEQHEKMTMIVNDKLKQMECQALKAERREEEREKQEKEREEQAQIKAHAMENNLQNLISKQFQEQYEKMTRMVNDSREEEHEKQEQEREEREEQAQIKDHAMANNLENMISKQCQEHEKMIKIVDNMQKNIENQLLAAECREQKQEKEEEEREKRADIRAHAIIWDIERQRYLYEQEQRQLRMAWNQGNCVNAVNELQFPQISHTSFHPPRVGSLYYDPTQSNEIPQAFQSLYHDIYGPRHQVSSSTTHSLYANHY